MVLSAEEEQIYL